MLPAIFSLLVSNILKDLKVHLLHNTLLFLKDFIVLVKRSPFILSLIELLIQISVSLDLLV